MHACKEDCTEIDGLQKNNYELITKVTESLKGILLQEYQFKLMKGIIVLTEYNIVN